MPSWPRTPALSEPLPISALVSAITLPLSVSQLSFHGPASLALPLAPLQPSPFLQTLAPAHTAFAGAGLGFPWQVRTEMPAAQLRPQVHNQVCGSVLRDSCLHSEQVPTGK